MQERTLWSGAPVAAGDIGVESAGGAEVELAIAGVARPDAVLDAVHRARGSDASAPAA